MAHCIEQPYDRVFSTVSKEWHGLATVVSEINRETIADNLFPIVEGEISISLDGETVKMDDKAIVADWRYRNDLPEGQKIRPLSVMGKDYAVIPNGQILEIVEKAISENGLDAKIITAGTLRSGKTFFLSLVQDDSSVNVLPGDNWDFHINCLSSHDGTDGLSWYLCAFRTVCMNTARWGCDSADTKATIYHTKNAQLAIKSLPELLVAMKNKQTDIVEAIAHLAGIKCDVDKAKKIVSGYYIGLQDEKKELSKRAENSIDAILENYRGGLGNNGESMYDLLNGFTQYYTSGDGTGKKTTDVNRIYKANFGAAADHKERFTIQMTHEIGRKKMESLGKMAIFES